MTRSKKFLAGLGQTGRTIVISTFALFLAAGIAQAATTISTNIDTAGTLSVTGQSSFGQASTTLFSATGISYFGGTATSTFSSAGALTLVGALSGTSGSFSTTLGVTGATTLSSTLAVTGATTLSASTTVGTATLFAGDDMNRVGAGTTTPLDILHVENQTATTTVVVSTGAAEKGGRLIIEDIDGAGCTEVSALNGALTAKVVTCPTGI